MYIKVKMINESVLAAIYEYEEQQLKIFRNKFDSLYLNILKSYGWNYRINIQRWIDDYFKRYIQLDGYTAMLQIDFIDDNDKIIEVDENVCSFFETITYIRFYPIRRKYEIFQKEELVELPKDIKRFLYSLKNSI